MEYIKKTREKTQNKRKKKKAPLDVKTAKP